MGPTAPLPTDLREWECPQRHHNNHGTNGSVVEAPENSRGLNSRQPANPPASPTGVPPLSLRVRVVKRDQPMRCGATVMDNEIDMESDWITELGKARSDEYTERILAFVQELEKSAPEPFLPLLTDLALARALIVHLVIRYGPERGMAEARDAFESTLEQMKPLLERLKSRKGPPPQ